MFDLFKFQLSSLRAGLSTKNLKGDLLAGSVVGLESVPDGLATGVLAGVNPVAGVYGSVYGFLGGAAFARTSFLAVQTTGAMAIIVADLRLDGEGGANALTTLGLLAGLFMLVATVAGAPRLLRYIPTAVMVGFINAVGLNIILGQIGDLTGYSSKQSNRVLKVIDTVAHADRIQIAILAVGVASVALILVLGETKLGSMGMLVAVGVASALAIAIGGPTETLADITEIPSSIPLPRLPDISAIPTVIVGALSLTFVGLVQGAGVASGLPEPDKSVPNAGQDFTAQAAGNALASVMGGMPVGGSMSGSALNVSAGAKSRLSYVYAAVIMVASMILLSGMIAKVAMPALAGLLLMVGIESLKPHRAKQVIRNGGTDVVTMVSTFVLCLVMPVQYAVVLGVLLAMVLYVVEHSSDLRFRRLETDREGLSREVAAPEVLQASDVVVLQPYGNLFFGSAPEVANQLPKVTQDSTDSVVVLRLRGVDPVGFAVSDVLKRYASSLRTVGSKLMIVCDDNDALDEFDRMGLTARLGGGNVYRGSRWYGDTTVEAVRDAHQWVAARTSA